LTDGTPYTREPGTAEESKTGIARRLDDAGRFGPDDSDAVDVDVQRHIPLHHLRVQRRRVSKGQLAVQHDGHDVRLRAVALHGIDRLGRLVTIDAG